MRLENLFRRPSLSQYIQDNGHQINKHFSTISLVALVCLSVSRKPESFLKGVAVGLAWQFTLILFQIQRPGTKGPRDHSILGSGGCADIMSGFIGANAFSCENTAATAWLAAEHISHSKNITYAHFFGACVGIRLALMVNQFFSKKDSQSNLSASLIPSSTVPKPCEEAHC